MNITTLPVKKPKAKLLPIHVYFKENLKRFLVETSLNGLKYIEDVHRNIWERLVIKCRQKIKRTKLLI